MECVRASEWMTPALVDNATNLVTTTAPVPLACRATQRNHNLGVCTILGVCFPKHNMSKKLYNKSHIVAIKTK
jgi:hypothetical protein